MQELEFSKGEVQATGRDVLIKDRDSRCIQASVKRKTSEHSRMEPWDFLHIHSGYDSVLQLQGAGIPSLVRKPSFPHAITKILHVPAKITLTK